MELIVYVLFFGVIVYAIAAIIALIKSAISSK